MDNHCLGVISQPSGYQWGDSANAQNHDSAFSGEIIRDRRGSRCEAIRSEMPAKTLEGFRAKARAVVYSYSSPEELEEEFTNTSVSHDIAWSLIRDLRQLA
jgi:hypothetical protein